MVLMVDIGPLAPTLASSGLRASSSRKRCL